MISHSYPKRDAHPDDVFTQRTFDLATAQLLSWQQGPGIFGGLYLHSAWGLAGVLDKRYQGQTTFLYHVLIDGYMKLFDRTGDLRWRTLADECVSSLLYLQTSEGGFRHASYEHEPTYDCEKSCPIHQGLPLLSLLDYAVWPSADPRRVAQIRPAIEAHWRWFERRWWRHGNRFRKPLPFAGFCGVTNQDLVIVAVLARYAEVYGDDSRYEQFGRPTLETYLSPVYYHEKLGMFERGDQANFVERTIYNEITLPMLERIQRTMPDSRLPGVIDNVCAHLFDAVYTDTDGLAHLAWGASTDPVDKSAVTGWIKHPPGLSSYPLLLPLMQSYLQRHPSTEKQALYDALEKTVAAYVLADGTLPVALGAKDALFMVTPQTENLWSYLLERLGTSVKSPGNIILPCIQRTCRDVTWRADARGWEIERDGQRAYAGWKPESRAIAIGPDETISGADFAPLQETEVHEHIGS